MSSVVFARIVSNYSLSENQIGKLSLQLSQLKVDDLITAERLSDFTNIEIQIIEAILNDLSAENIFSKSEYPICPNNDSPMESKLIGNGYECDLCAEKHPAYDISVDQFYSLRQLLLFSFSQSGALKREASVENFIANGNNQKRSQITPWSTLQPQDYLVSMPTLDPGARERTLSCLQQYGIALLRLHGDAPTKERLQSLEGWIGPARERQNDVAEKVKSLVPKYDAPPVSGDSAKALPPHVDGTQDEITPAILAFQYELGGSWGAESIFLDMAALFASMNYRELCEILVTLARKDACTCTKQKGDWIGRYAGPIIRAENGGESISIRVREDDLLVASPDCSQSFERLKTEIKEWSKTKVLRFTPQEGDIVIFDNWRVLHARAAIGGRHQRIHHRIWIDNLLPEYIGKYRIGIRPIAPDVMHKIQSANAG